MTRLPVVARIEDFQIGQRARFSKTFVVRSVDRARHRLEIDAWIENTAGEHVIEGACEAGLLRA